MLTSSPASRNQSKLLGYLVIEREEGLSIKTMLRINSLGKYMIEIVVSQGSDSVLACSVRIRINSDLCLAMLIEALRPPKISDVIVTTSTR